MFHDIITSEEALGSPGLPWWAWLGIIVSIVVLAPIAYWLLKTRSKKSPPAVKTLADALQALTKLKQRELDLSEQSTEISLLMRRFLMIHFEDPALYETHEEYLARGRGLEHLPERSHTKLANYLTMLAEQKYGQSSTNHLSKDNTFDQTESLMRALDSTVPVQIAP